MIHASIIEDPPLFYMTAAVLSQALVMSMQKFIYRHSQLVVDPREDLRSENPNTSV